MDRNCAELLMRHMSAIDLLIGGATEVLRHHPDADPSKTMLDALFRATNELHVGVRRRVIDAYPDLDYDKP